MTKARDLANSAAAFASVSATELGFVDGVTSAIQTQMDAKAPSSTAVTLTGTQTLTNKTLTSPVIASVINNTLTSTTGDIIYASAANTPARLGIGSSAQVLTVASGVPSWATPAVSSSGLVVVKAETTFTTVATTTTTFDNVFTSTYDHYIIKFRGNSSTSTELKFQMRSSAPATLTNNYYGGRYGLGYTGGSTASQFSGATQWDVQILGPNSYGDAFTININGVGSGSQTVNTEWQSGGAGGNNGFYVGGGESGFTMAATGFILSATSGTITGRVTVYGLAKA